ncbi:MAG TPA: osmotically inducible protein OsmC [Nitrospirae bacterium]|nr:osmotically inducible protein OsmC [Nitrospirota bacterium]
MKSAIVKWVDGFQFIGQSGSGHSIVIDGDKSSGGGSAMTPMELLMIGLGGCSGMDVISVLNKKKQEVFDFKVNVSGNLANEYPKRYTDMNLEFVVIGRNIDENAVKKAIDLSMDKYCSVKATLEGSAKITFNYKIENI